MATLRKLVSDVRSMHRLTSTDASITDRAIASEIRSVSLLLIKRETNLRKLWATDTLFTTIPCLEMIQVPISECCEYVDSSTISRSKFKLPPISEGNYQYVIQGVYSINAMGGKGKKLKEISINRYLNLLKLNIRKHEDYFWINNNYLYVTNPEVKSVRISALFETDVPNEIMFPDCDCGTSSSSPIEERCMNPLDKNFSLPGYLENQVLQITSQRLLSTYYNLKEDNSSDGLDVQAPNVQPTR